MYDIRIKRQVKRKLQTLDIASRKRILAGIVRLEREPQDLTLDIRQLVNQSLYRLRIGKWRVIFARDEVMKIVSIEKIGSRGDVYK